MGVFEAGFFFINLLFLVLLEVTFGHLKFYEVFTYLFPFKNDSLVLGKPRICKINVKVANNFNLKLSYLLTAYK